MCILTIYPYGQQCTAYFITDFLFLIIFSEVHSSWGASLRYFSHPLLIFCLTDPDTPISTLFSSILFLCSSLKATARFYIHKTENINLTLNATRICLARFRDSSVGIATRYVLSGPGTEVR